MSRKPALYRPKPAEAVWLTWVDALYDGTYDGSAEAYEPETPILHELGFYVKQNRSIFVLAACYDPSTKTFRFMQNIPRTLIRSISPLVLPSETPSSATSPA